MFYKTQINSKIQNLFIEYHISKKLSPHHSDSLQNIESNLDNKTPTEDNLIKKSFEKKISTPEKKDLEILTSKTPKKIPKILPIVLKSKNPKISAEGSNKKIEKSPISIKPEQKIESLTKKIEEPTENIKKQAISRKIEGLLDVSKCPQAQVVSTPLKNKKVEGLSGNENLILYEIKANGLTSLRKQLIDPSEESRYSIQSQDNMTKSNILERFLVNFEEEEEFEEQKFH